MGMTIAIDKSYMNRMPKSCKECPLTYLDTGDDAYFGANERRCVIDDSCIDGMVSERAYDCPLIEAIPKVDIQKALKEGSKDISENVLAIVKEEYISKADYENRLKADLKAILVELQLEIEELKSYESSDGQDLVMLADIGTLFQQKINNLKED